MQKAFDHNAFEDDIYKSWEDSGKMRADANSEKEPFTIVLPPPNVTGNLHLGHAAMLAIEDIMIRYKKMQGYESLWVPGTDHAAIATENVVIKHLGLKKREEMKREDFLEEAKKFAGEKHDNIINQSKKMGAWLDWSRESYTLDEARNHSVMSMFKKLHEDGLIERGYRMINWSVGAQSVLADDELEWEDVKEPFYYIRCGEFILGTVRSETKCANSPVIVHPEGEYVRVKFTPDDGNLPRPLFGKEGGSETFIFAKVLFDDKERLAKMLNLLEGEFELIETIKGSDLVGKEFEYETYAGKRKFVVMADEVIDMEKGTGAMSISVNHATDDYELAQKYDLTDYYIEKINFNGKMTAVAGLCEGMEVAKARKESGKIMKEMGLLAGQDNNYVHRVPTCYRSNCVVEPMISPQWFIMVNKEFQAPKLQRLYFARHGESEWNAAKIIQGGSEAPNGLTDKGKAQALELAQKAKSKGLKKIISSNLDRARETAEIVAQELGLEVEIWPELHEYRLGDLEGTPALEVFGEKKIDTRKIAQMFDEGTLPDGAESLKDLEVRGRSIWGKIEKENLDQVLIVSHASFLTTLLHLEENKELEALLPLFNCDEFTMPNCALKEIQHVSAKTEATTLCKLTADAVKDDHVKIIPKRFEKQYFQWTDNLRDWCISRQIWWGHRIPVWYDKSKKEEGGREKVYLPEEQKVFFIRHGQTATNISGVYNKPDEVLTEVGKQQISEVAPSLKNRNITKIISSSLPRAKESAEIIAQELGIKGIEYWDEIIEGTVGDLAGKSRINPETGKEEHTIEVICKGRGGETEKEFKARAAAFWKRIKDVYTDGNILVVSHGGMICNITAERSGVQSGQLLAYRNQAWNVMGNGEMVESSFYQAPKLQNKLIFVRHGESEAARDNMFSGTIDSPLTDKGRGQAKETAQKLKGANITKIITSDLSRAADTAQIIKDELGLTPEIEVWPEITEFDWGKFEGTHFESKEDLEKAAEVETGETSAQILARAKDVWKRLGSVQTEGEILIAGHNTLTAALYAYREGITAEEFPAFRANWHMEPAEALFDSVSKEFSGKNIIYARHGESEANAARIVQPKNSPLTKAGRKHAVDLAADLKEKHVSKIITSPTTRALETAEIVAKELGGLEVEVMEEFSGYDTGALKGLGIEELGGMTPIEKANEVGTGESIEDYYARIKKGYKALGNIETEGSVLVVSHRTVFSAIQSCREGKPATDIFARRAQNRALPHGILEESTLPASADAGLVQDEDTLDTWFSSALWPYSTLGWDGSTPSGSALKGEKNDLDKFYPNSVLETGWDILTFWVLRMIMFGRYATGKYPFHTVYLHGLVCDEKGKKMSKSKGNGIDPLDVIEEVGADAVRLSLVVGTSPGNPIPLGKNKIKGYRNFVNKLWNAGRFVQMQSIPAPSFGKEGSIEAGKEEVGSKNLEVDVTSLSLADKWILSRLSSVCNQVAKHLDKYEISAAGDLIYHFVWDEFCDWYIEASKVDMNPDILKFVYGEILKLTHPICPFVTEAIWQELFSADESIMDFQFPILELEDVEIEKTFETVQNLVGEIRKIRSEKKLNPKDKIEVSVKSSDENIIDSKEVLEVLANLSEAKISSDVEKPERAVVSRVDGVEIYVDIPFDEAAEKIRLEKELEQLSKKKAGLEGRLSNPSYTEKAPAHLVDQTKAELVEVSEKLETVETELKNLG